MPKCKNCLREIAKTDYDVCPYCGTKDPIPADYQTMDVTSLVSKMSPEELPHAKSLKVFRLLALTLGFFGAPWFYIKKQKAGWISLVVSLLSFAVFGLLLYCFAWNNAYIFLIVFGSVWLLQAMFCLVYSFRSNLKDGNGEFLR
ncbi:MAG: hypothetical protein ACI32C_02810 [Candidatus Enteromonas sp.]